jgi:NTP pyrophosphatase (non-canonical NTP hydrolase)
MAYNNVGIGDYLNGVKAKPSYRPMESLTEFHHAFAPDQSIGDLADTLERRKALIREEYLEVMDALNLLERSDLGYTSYDPEELLVEVAAELADLLYVVYGTAEELSIPLQEVFQAIHAANMRKVWDDGKVYRNEFGKVIKPPNFVKADIRKVMYGESDNTEEG